MPHRLWAMRAMSCRLGEGSLDSRQATIEKALGRWRRVGRTLEPEQTLVSDGLELTEIANKGMAKATSSGCFYAVLSRDTIGSDKCEPAVIEHTRDLAYKTWAFLEAAPSTHDIIDHWPCRAKIRYHLMVVLTHTGRDPWSGRYRSILSGCV